MDVAELLVHAEIRQALTTYCRGVDRADPALIASAFHDGARLRYGEFDTTVAQFSERVVAGVAGLDIAGQHHVTNVHVALADAVAHVESYFLVLRPTRLDDGGQALVPLGGRYLDRFELRGGRWRIVERTVVRDWISDQLLPKNKVERGPRYPQGSAGESDPAYAFFRNLVE